MVRTVEHLSEGDKSLESLARHEYEQHDDAHPDEYGEEEDHHSALIEEFANVGFSYS